MRSTGQRGTSVLYRYGWCLCRAAICLCCNGIDGQVGGILGIDGEVGTFRTRVIANTSHCHSGRSCINVIAIGNGVVSSTGQRGTAVLHRYRRCLCRTIIGDCTDGVDGNIRTAHIFTYL